MRHLRGGEWVESPLRRKRDVVLASAVLPFVGPVGASALALARAADGPEPLFRQERVGKAGARFEIYKVRTMPDGQTPSRLGAVFRLAGIDETPQIVNILRGELAIFGPRALTGQDIDAMHDNLPLQTFDQWYDIYSRSGPGCISTFTHLAHGEGEQGDRTYGLRARLDIADYAEASPAGDMRMLARVGQTAFKIATG